MPTLCKVVQTNDALATLISENKVSLLGTHLRMLVTVLGDTCHQHPKTMIIQEKFILIDFHATWCGPCKQIAPYLESLAGQYPDNLIIVKVRIITMLLFHDFISKRYWTNIAGHLGNTNVSVI